MADEYGFFCDIENHPDYIKTYIQKPIHTDYDYYYYEKNTKKDFILDIQNDYYKYNDRITNIAIQEYSEKVQRVLIFITMATSSILLYNLYL